MTEKASESETVRERVSESGREVRVRQSERE